MGRNVADNKSFVRNQQGFQLIEILVGMGLTAFIVGGAMDFANQSSSLTNASKLLRVRDSINQELQNAIQTRGNLNASLSASGNDALSKCITGKDLSGTIVVNGCTALASGVPLVNNMQIVRNDGSGTLIADGTNPIIYDRNGSICATASNVCPLMAYASFTAKCKNGADTCTKAEAVQISYTLQPATGVNVPTLASISTSIEQFTTDIALNICPLNRVARGINANGSLDCWVWQFGNDGGDTDVAKQILKDSQNNIYVIGYTTEYVNNETDILIIKYSSSGIKLWSRQFGTSGGYENLATVVPAAIRNDSLYITGYTLGSFPGFSNPDTTGNTGDVFLAGYDLNGNQKFPIQQKGTSGHDFVDSIVVDSNENIYVIIMRMEILCPDSVPTFLNFVVYLRHGTVGD